jgi:hypothetical protein
VLRLRPWGFRLRQGSGGQVGETGSDRTVSLGGVLRRLKAPLKSSLSRRSPEGGGGAPTIDSTPKVSALERAKKKARNRMGR